MTVRPSSELLAAITHIKEAMQAAEAAPGTSWPEHLTFPPAVIPDNVLIRQVRIADRAAEWIERRGADRSVRLLVIHGGGFVSGGLPTYRHFAVTLAERAGFPVLLLDYRLAPEHPYPAGLDDCVAAADWLWRNEIDGVCDADQLYIVGDSAGGNLALTTALRCRADALQMPDGLVLLSPWTDLSMTRPSHAALQGSDFMVGKSMGALHAAISAGLMRASDQPYLAGHAADDPFVSPLFADLVGLPPMLCLVADDEALLDDSVELSTRADSAGVPFRLERVRGVFHAWPIFGRFIPEAMRAIELMTESIYETVQRNRAERRTRVE